MNAPLSARFTAISEAAAQLQHETIGIISDRQFWTQLEAMAGIANTSDLQTHLRRAAKEAARLSQVAAAWEADLGGPKSTTEEGKR